MGKFKRLGCLPQRPQWAACVSYTQPSLGRSQSATGVGTVPAVEQPMKSINTFAIYTILGLGLASQGCNIDNPRTSTTESELLGLGTGGSVGEEWDDPTTTVEWVDCGEKRVYFAGRCRGFEAFETLLDPGETLVTASGVRYSNDYDGTVALTINQPATLLSNTVGSLQLVLSDSKSAPITRGGFGVTNHASMTLTNAPADGTYDVATSIKRLNDGGSRYREQATIDIGYAFGTSSIEVRACADEFSAFEGYFASIEGCDGGGECVAWHVIDGFTARVELDYDAGSGCWSGADYLAPSGVPFSTDSVCETAGDIGGLVGNLACFGLAMTATGLCTIAASQVAGVVGGVAGLGTSASTGNLLAGAGVFGTAITIGVGACVGMGAAGAAVMCSGDQGVGSAIDSAVENLCNDVCEAGYLNDVWVLGLGEWSCTYNGLTCECESVSEGSDVPI